MALFIKYVETDPGTRPCTGAFWASPAIWLTDTSNALKSKARVSETCRIHVQVDSDGGSFTTGSPPPPLLTVQVWVCNPAIGAGPDAMIPTFALDTLGNPDKYGKGNSVQTTVAPPPKQSMLGASTYVEWVPQAGDLPMGATEAHLCVGARCVFSTSLTTPGTINSGLLDPCNTKEHGQKNITLVSATAPPGPMMSEFMAGAPEEGGEELVELELLEHKPGRQLELVELELLVGDGFARIVGLEDVDPRKYRRSKEPLERKLLREGAKVVLAGKRAVPIRPAEKGEGRARLESKHPSSEHGKRGELGLKLRPGEQTVVRATLNMAKEDKPGAVRVWDVVGRGRSGRELGGLRIVGVVAAGGK